MLFLRVIAWYGAEKFSLKKVVSIFTSGGDMSLVGPRPERPELQKEIEKEAPEFGLRLQANMSIVLSASGKTKTLMSCSLGVINNILPIINKEDNE